MEYLIRLLHYVTVTLLAGSVALPVILGARGVPPHVGAEYLSRWRNTGVVAALVLVALAVPRLYLQLDAMRFPDEPLFQSFGVLMRETSWGRGWVLQLVSACVLLVALPSLARTGARPPGTLPILMSGAALVGIALSIALSGHAAGASPVALALAAGTVHVLGAGSWIGSLAHLTAALLVPARSAPPSGIRQASAAHSAASRSVERGEEPAAFAPSHAAQLYTMVKAFSPVALVGAGAVLLTGVAASLLHLGGIANLTTTPYGRTLLLKLLLVVGVGAAGFRNWRVNTPRAASGDPRSLRRGALLELALATAVIAVTSVLVVTPPPFD